MTSQTGSGSEMIWTLKADLKLRIHFARSFQIQIRFLVQLKFHIWVDPDLQHCQYGYNASSKCYAEFAKSAIKGEEKDMDQKTSFQESKT